MQITEAATADTTTWTGAINGTAVAWLSVWTANGEIAEVEVASAHQGEGHARALYTHADATFPGGVFHTIEAHRTAEGDGFARAVGGDTVAEARVIDVCCCDHCDPQDIDEDDEDY